MNHPVSYQIRIRGRLGQTMRRAFPRIRILAQAVEPATVRILDAIHLGIALQSRAGLTSFVTYDKRLLDAAQTAGLPVDSPA